MSVNESEERLAEQSRRTFLSMWSYQNPHYDNGKELCDVLVVHGGDVLIMSDKVISYHTSAEPSVAWKRWYRRAVEASVSQLRGAKRTIMTRPTCIHLDASVSAPFPFMLPTSPRIHLIAVAHGAEEACQRAFGRPSLTIHNRLEMTGQPFHVGVEYPEFVHVFNRTALDALFACFDTAVDLIRYLQEKEQLFLADKCWVRGEEELIARYMRTWQASGQDFVAKLGGQQVAGEPAAKEAEWMTLCESPDFVQRRRRLAPSYLIDELIEQVASEYAGGRMLVGQDLDFAAHEMAFRALASESRMARLVIGAALLDVLTDDSRYFWGNAVTSPGNPEMMYVWLVYPQAPDQVPPEYLERVVARQLAKYVFVAMAKFPKAHRFFGIAMPNLECEQTSRLYRLTQRDVWTAQMQDDAEALSLAEGIFDNIEGTTYVAQGRGSCLRKFEVRSSERSVRDA